MKILIITLSLVFSTFTQASEEQKSIRLCQKIVKESKTNISYDGMCQQAAKPLIFWKCVDKSVKKGNSFVFAISNC